MFKIYNLTQSSIVGYADDIHYIKKSNNGTLIASNKEDAIGISFNSTPYNLDNHEAIDGADQVVVSVVDSGEVIISHNQELAAKIDYIAMMSEVNLDE